MTTIDKATLDKLLEGVEPSNPQSMFTDAGLFGQLKKALAERMLQAELTHHLEQQRNAPEQTRNHRNGSSKKSVLAAETKLTLDIPRDRDGSFEPQLVAKHQRRLPGFDNKVISLYARGLPVREIQGHLTELYGLEVSPDLISTITGEVMDEVIEWQNRPLEPMYPLVFFDALRVKIRDEGTVKNKAVYLALGVRADGTKEILAIWIEQMEGAKFWLRVMTELKNRGVEDVLITVVDVLKGFPQAINAVFPQAQIQTCIARRTSDEILKFTNDFGHTKILTLPLVPLLAAGALPDLEHLQHELAPRPGLYPSVTVRLPELASYDCLLEAA